MGKVNIPSVICGLRVWGFRVSRLSLRVVKYRFKVDIEFWVGGATNSYWALEYHTLILFFLKEPL